MKKSSSLTLLLLSAAPLVSQISGEFRGIVLDPNGASVAQASLTLTGLEQGSTRRSNTDSEGRFLFPLLPVGRYELKVEAPGFRAASLETWIGAGEASHARIPLELGQVTESVTVTGAVSPLDNGTPQLQSSLAGEKIQEIPVNRLPNSFALLSTGVIPPPPNSSFLGTGNYSANGGRARANNITIDNITSTDVVVTGTAGPLGTLSFAQIKEVKLITNNFNAEYGRNSGSQLLYITRSGSRDLHGELYDYLQNDQLNARSWFDRTGKRGILRQNQYGYALGGPVLIPRLYDGRNRTFFFTTYEGQKTRGEGAAVIAQVPTSAMLARVANPSAKALLDQYRLPAAASESSNFGQVQQTAPNRVDAYQFSARADHTFSEKDFFWTRYSRYVQTARVPGLMLLGSNLSGYGGFAATPAHQATLAETHILSPAMVNEFRAAFGRSAPDFRLDSSFPAGPRVTFLDGSVSAFGSYEGFPQGRLQNTYQLSDNLSWTRGAHILKFGAEIHRLQVNSYLDAIQRPLLSFANWNDFAAGIPARYQQRFGSSVRGNRVWNHFFFAQDDWRVTRNLTLNLGLRLEIAGGVSEVNNLTSNLDLDCRRPVGAAGAGPLGCFTIGGRSFQTNYNGEPRFGFAWNPAGSRSTVVRGGYGIAHDFLFMGPINNQRFLPPFIITAGLTGQAAFDPIGPNSLARILAGAAQAQQEARAAAGAFNPAALNFGSLNPVLDQGLANPYAQHWNFGLQREIKPGWIAKAAYVGTAGRHLLRSRPINLIANPPVPAAAVADETARLSQFQSSFSAGTGAVTRRSNRVDPRFNEVVLLESSASSTYHSLQLELDKRFSSGYSLRAGFTFGKSIDDVSDALSVFANDSSLQQNPFSHRDNRAVSQFDLARRFFLLHQWELPWGRAIRNPFLRRLAAGWGFAGISSLRSGFPVTHEAGARRGISALTLTGITGGPVRPNAAGPVSFDPKPAGNPDVLQGLLNPDGVQNIAAYGASLGLSQPLLGNYGALGRNSHRLNGEVDFDWNVYKNVPLSERMKFQVRCEMYNTFNNTSFYNVNRNLTNPAFGQYTAAGQAARSMQVAARLVF